MCSLLLTMEISHLLSTILHLFGLKMSLQLISKPVWCKEDLALEGTPPSIGSRSTVHNREFIMEKSASACLPLEQNVNRSHFLR